MKPIVISNVMDFYNELASNNNKEWFDAQKERYQNDVKRPFYELVSAVIDQLQSEYENVSIKPEDAIFRIHRDLRFTNDKSPYKTHSSALISKVGRRSKEVPGLYIEIGQHNITIAGGLFKLTKKAALILRNNERELFNKMRSTALDWEINLGDNSGYVTATLISSPYNYSKELLVEVCSDFWKRILPVNEFLYEKIYQKEHALF